MHNFIKAIYQYQLHKVVFMDPLYVDEIGSRLDDMELLVRWSLPAFMHHRKENVKDSGAREFWCRKQHGLVVLGGVAKL